MGVLLALDPGGTTGVALKIGTTYITSVETIPQNLWDFINTHRPSAVAFEAFHTGGRVDEAIIHTIELVGSIRGICHILNIPAYGQMPQSRYPFLEIATKMLSSTKPRPTKHEHDALAHLLLLEWRMETNRL